jgi:hypothetical protein
VDEIRAIVTHPKAWDGVRANGIHVRHVSIGGDNPRRLDGTATGDGIGDMVTDLGIAKLYDTVDEFKPHIFMFGIHFGLDRKMVQNAMDLCPDMKVVMHYTDQRVGVPSEVSKYSGLIDLLLVTNDDASDMTKYLEANVVKDVATFYDGFDPMEYWPVPMETKYDVFFGGNNHWRLYHSLMPDHKRQWPQLDFPGGEFRHHLVKEIDRRFSTLIRGKFGWDHKNDKWHNLFPMVFHPHLLREMRSARIVLATSVAKRRGLVMRRIIRGLAAGRLLVAEYVPGMEEMFENHKHLVWFDSIHEAIDVIGYYLSHEDERERIAIDGVRLALKKHTFAHRLSTFVTLIREHLL